MGDREGSFNGFLSGVTPGVKGGEGVGKVLTSTNGPDHHSGHAPLRQPVAAGGPLLHRRSGPPAATEITPSVVLDRRSGKRLPAGVQGRRCHEDRALKACRPVLQLTSWPQSLSTWSAQ
jgi:hypothetical protein